MNKPFLESYLKSKPENDREKFIFIVSDANLAIAIIGCGFRSVALTEEFGVSDFVKSVGGTEHIATTRQEFTYILACASKTENDKLEKFLKSECLQNRPGWQKFWDKFYLGKSEYESELKKFYLILSPDWRGLELNGMNSPI